MSLVPSRSFARSLCHSLADCSPIAGEAAGKVAGGLTGACPRKSGHRFSDEGHAQTKEADAGVLPPFRAQFAAATCRLCCCIRIEETSAATSVCARTAGWTKKRRVGLAH